MFIVGYTQEHDGISDLEYSKFEELAPPKILFSCEKTRDLHFACFVRDIDNPQLCTHLEGKEVTEKVYVGYIAQMGAGLTYNKMLQSAYDKCNSLKAELKVLEGVKK